MQRAFVVTLVVAAPMALLSCFLVLRGWSLMGDAISHAVLPGIVLAYWLAIPLAIGAFAAGMFCAVAIGFLKENSRIKEDTVMGIVFSGMFGLGIVLYVRTVTDVHLDHILFGDPLGIAWRDVAESAAIAALVTVAVLLRRRDLLVYAFDAQHARAIGLPVRLLHYGFLALVSLTVVAALQAVGIILAIALLIGPGATAFLWVRSFGAMLAVASVVASLAAVAGVYASFWLDSAPGPTVVLAMTALFVASLGATRLRPAPAAETTSRRPAPAPDKGSALTPGAR
ncbi:MAG: metal ABC transporter permease [Rhodobacteraceae bacterium]|nr:metal ABC transporter permease [Paracoccaceae bacterium]